MFFVSAVVASAVHYAHRAPSVPTFAVKRGDFVDSLDLRGEVKALRSVTLSAPANGEDLEILKIASDGAQVNSGDKVVEFDKTKTEQSLSQYRSSLRFTQADIEQARAQGRLTEEQDLTAVLKARYELEKAKLDAGQQEIVSKIEGEEAKLKVADAEQKLRESETKLQSDRDQNHSAIKNKIQASKKVAFDVARAERALSEMTLVAPGAGAVSLVKNWRAEGEAAFKPGDRVWPGAPLVELPDSSSLRVHLRVDETERGRLAVNQAATVELDAIPDRQFTGRIEQVSTLASEDFSAGWPVPRNFDLSVQLDQYDARLKPGMSARVNVVADRVAGALVIPAQSSFPKEGRTIAYVWDGSRFRERSIEIARRSGDRILVVQGLEEGDRVALKDPTMNP
ncbi:MAG TPA: efflux RND transporter periplasmic adaptor subunit [Sphingomicrobium sp.]|nr:efflux RND transporter periplasmic adaptor subunit [Sphingomicrobium sp.]